MTKTNTTIMDVSTFIFLRKEYKFTCIKGFFFACNFRVKSTVVESSALNDSYGDNTFVDESTLATSRDKMSKKSPRSPLDQLSRHKINIPLAGDLKLRRHGNRGRSSESESEESISHTGIAKIIGYKAKFFSFLLMEILFPLTMENVSDFNISQCYGEEKKFFYMNLLFVIRCFDIHRDSI